MPSAQVWAFLSEKGFETLREKESVVDKLETPSFLRSTDEFILCVVLKSVGNVLLYGTWEDCGFLIDHTDFLPDFSDIKVFWVNISIQNSPIAYSIEFLDQFYDGWFSTSTLTDKGYILTFFDIEV